MASIERTLDSRPPGVFRVAGDTLATAAMNTPMDSIVLLEIVYPLSASHFLTPPSVWHPLTLRATALG